MLSPVENSSSETTTSHKSLCASGPGSGGVLSASSCRTVCVRDGICVAPPLCRGTSQGKQRSCTEGLVYVGDVAGNTGEVDERELVLVVGVKCGKKMRHDTWMTLVSGHKDVQS